MGSEMCIRDSSLICLGQGGSITWLGLMLSAAAALALRQCQRWERGLLAGDGIAPRNLP